VNATAGVASFSGLSINRSSTNTYTLSATASGLASATSGTFLVNTGPISQMLFIPGPSNVNQNSAFNPVVRVGLFDAQFNQVTTATATNTITLAIGTNPGSGTL